MPPGGSFAIHRREIASFTFNTFSSAVATTIKHPDDDYEGEQQDNGDARQDRRTTLTNFRTHITQSETKKIGVIKSQSVKKSYSRT